jgi:hypothetical protein
MGGIYELFQGIMNMGEPWHMIVLVVLISCATGVVTSMFKQIRKYGCHRRDVDLKRDLVERGLNVDEIERIVAAKGSASKDSAAN